MKYQALDHGSFRLFVQRIQGNDFDRLSQLTKPNPESVKSSSVFESILRWEDDGGQILNVGDLLNSDRTFINKLMNDKLEKHKLSRHDASSRFRTV